MAQLKKFTKKQKLEILKKAKKHYQKRPKLGICAAINYILMFYYDCYGYLVSDIQKRFGMLKYKPENAGSYWWGRKNTRARITVFNKLIKDHQ